MPASQAEGNVGVHVQLSLFGAFDIPENVGSAPTNVFQFPVSTVPPIRPVRLEEEEPYEPPIPSGKPAHCQHPPERCQVTDRMSEYLLATCHICGTTGIRSDRGDDDFHLYK